MLNSGIRKNACVRIHMLPNAPIPCLFILFMNNGKYDSFAMQSYLMAFQLSSYSNLSFDANSRDLVPMRQIAWKFYSTMKMGNHYDNTELAPTFWICNARWTNACHASAYPIPIHSSCYVQHWLKYENDQSSGWIFHLNRAIDLLNIFIVIKELHSWTVVIVDVVTFTQGGIF